MKKLLVVALNGYSGLDAAFTLPADNCNTLDGSYEDETRGIDVKGPFAVLDPDDPNNGLAVALKELGWTPPVSPLTAGPVPFTKPPRHHFQVIERPPLCTAVDIGDVDDEGDRVIWIEAPSADRVRQYMFERYPGLRQIEISELFRPVTKGEGLDLSIT